MVHSPPPPLETLLSTLDLHSPDLPPTLSTPEKFPSSVFHSRFPIQTTVAERPRPLNPVQVQTEPQSEPSDQFLHSEPITEETDFENDDLRWAKELLGIYQPPQNLPNSQTNPTPSLRTLRELVFAQEQEEDDDDDIFGESEEEEGQKSPLLNEDRPSLNQIQFLKELASSVHTKRPRPNFYDETFQIYENPDDI